MFRHPKHSPQWSAATTPLSRQTRSTIMRLFEGFMRLKERRYYDRDGDIQVMSPSTAHILNRLFRAYNETSGLCTISIEKLDKQMSVCRRTIIYALRALEEMGIIQIKRRRDWRKMPDGSVQWVRAVNQYIFAGRSLLRALQQAIRQDSCNLWAFLPHARRSLMDYLYQKQRSWQWKTYRLRQQERMEAKAQQQAVETALKSLLSEDGRALRPDWRHLIQRLHLPDMIRSRLYEVIAFYLDEWQKQIEQQKQKWQSIIAADESLRKALERPPPMGKGQPPDKISTQVQQVLQFLDYATIIKKTRGDFDDYRKKTMRALCPETLL